MIAAGAVHTGALLAFTPMVALLVVAFACVVPVASVLVFHGPALVRRVIG